MSHRGGVGAIFVQWDHLTPWPHMLGTKLPNKGRKKGFNVTILYFFLVFAVLIHMNLSISIFSFSKIIWCFRFGDVLHCII